jgi:hypothetical protein
MTKKNQINEKRNLKTRQMSVRKCHTVYKRSSTSYFFCFLEVYELGLKLKNPIIFPIKANGKYGYLKMHGNWETA